MGATFSLHGGSTGVPGSTSTGATNLLRTYDIDQGYTFNMAEFSIKRDPDEAFPFGGGLVLTAGQDVQKNHSIGILRDDNDAFPFRNTPVFDVEEAYISARIPIGNGPVVKVGKFVTLLGYEVIESPNNLNVQSAASWGRGVVKLVRGDAKAAAEEMQKCVPTFDLCHFHLAIAQEKAGDKAGAQATRATLLAQQRSQDTFFLSLRSQLLKKQVRTAAVGGPEGAKAN